MAFRTVALGLGALLALGAVEAILRLSGIWIGRHSDTMFSVMEYDAVLGWKMKPHLRARVDLVDVEGIPVASNGLGFLDREFILRKPADRCRIVFLGDSFTWGYGVREDERFSNVLARLRPDWEALNFGIAGYGTDQSLLVWRSLAHRYHPDVVVLTIDPTDYEDNLHAVLYGRSKPYFNLKPNGTVELKGVPVPPRTFWDDGVYYQAAPPYASIARLPFEKRSRVVHWLVKHMDSARLLYTVLRPSIGPKPIESSKGDAVRFELLGALVAQLDADVRAQGARFLVVLAGNSGPYYEFQEQRFRRQAIAYVDATTAALARTLHVNADHVYYRYNGHWTPPIHRVIATWLAVRIQRDQLCRTAALGKAKFH